MVLRALHIYVNPEAFKFQFGSSAHIEGYTELKLAIGLMDCAVVPLDKDTDFLKINYY